MPALRAPQAKLKQGIQSAWSSGAQVVMAVGPTGFGKTVTFADLLLDESDATAAIAHRRELVGQMSLALARNAVRHRVIGPKELCRQIVTAHMAELGRSYYDPSAKCGVVGIDSLPGLSACDPWLGQVRMWVGDEGHHFLRDNKWGRGVALFRRAERGVLFTATSFRADRKGLGRGVLLPDGVTWSNDGIADALVLGPTMGEQIAQGYLTNFRLFTPPSDVDYSDVNVTDSGDLSPVKLRAAVHRSTRFVGDIVAEYLRIAPGKLGVTFAVDVESATKIAVAFRMAGVPAEVVSANTPDGLRRNILQRFRRREILQLINVDLFGEGFDLPAIEVVSMGRKTESKALFDQQFGRALRLMVDEDVGRGWEEHTVEERLAHIAASSKPYAIIIDHVGNIERHLPPTAPRYHTLARGDRRIKSDFTDAIPMRTCLNPDPVCAASYERVLKACPICGFVPEPGRRDGPQYVDGVLHELLPDVLAAMIKARDLRDAPPLYPANSNIVISAGIRNRHDEAQQAQARLRKAMALWAGHRTGRLGQPLDEAQRRFYYMFGVDVLTAQAFPRAEAEALALRIETKNAIDGLVTMG
jgi:superfamily II DNA or RNA helicase